MYFFFGIIFIVLDVCISININKIKHTQRKLVFWSLLIAANLLIAMRPETIPDYVSYLNIFKYIQPGKNYGFDLWSRHYQTGIEYGFLYLISWMKVVVGNNFRMFLGILSFATSTSAIFALKKIVLMLEIAEENKQNENQLEVIISCIYFSYFLLNYEGIAIRQAVSISLCLWGFICFYNKKYIQTCLLYFAGFLVQRMTIIGLISLLVYSLVPALKNKKNIIKITGIVGAMCTLVYISPLYARVLRLMQGVYSLLFTKINYMSYIENLSYDVAFDKKRLFLLVIMCFVLYFLSEEQASGKIFNVFFVGILIMVCTMNISGSARIYDYLTVFYIPLISSSYGKYGKKLGYKVGMIGIVLVNYYISLRIWEIF